ncbi:MAG TPA: MmcQ/YjbR family DNA-binding protein [Usitatibacteraceae bacterium]|nr:MmcQ/YjbR family DNA-binding protein [Usitatibacteraceae bacterium]
MASVATARKSALACPEAVEGAHMGHPDFRVGGRIFMTLWPDKKRVVLKLPLADQQALVQMDPEAFSVGSWGRQGYTLVDLARVNAAQLRVLADAAWRTVASRRLQEQYPLDD